MVYGRGVALCTACHHYPAFRHGEVDSWRGTEDLSARFVPKWESGDLDDREDAVLPEIAPATTLHFDLEGRL